MKVSVLWLVVLLSGSGLLVGQTTTANVSVDVNGARRTISPDIYGVAWATSAELNDLNVPLNRHGGNTTTRYNWQQNAANHGFDWYFESIARASATPGAEADDFITTTRAGGAEPMITIPMIPWVAKVSPTRQKLCSFSIAKYGPQTDNDWEWFPDAGNGVSAATGQPINGNDPNDANVPSTPEFQGGWVQHLVDTWGGAAGGGLKYYILDNEASIWFSTHRDVAPTGQTMEQMLTRTISYAQKVKQIDPAARIAWPEEWGWGGFIWSGFDQQWASAANGWDTPDRDAHGGWDYLPWMLKGLRDHYSRSGERLLDVFTVHFYPQSGEFTGGTDSAMQLLRNKSTRSLWDPAYVDVSWIDSVVQLVPRLQSWRDTYYPGAKTGITEYNWGAENHINGATTQADILGIFGREGLDMAARWTTPASSTPTYKAIRMYRNYDGAKSTFGDVSLPLTGANPDDVSSFAALRSTDGALTVMVINKQLATAATLQLSFANFAHQGVAKAYRLTSSNSITALPDIPFGGTQFSSSLPAQSITIYVIAPADVSAAPVVATVTPKRVGATAHAQVTISGANFRPGATVKVGNAAATVSAVTPTSITATVPDLVAGTLNPLTVTNPNTLSGSLQDAIFTAFTDVPETHPFRDYVEKIARARITLGCAAGLYCPGEPVSRSQMALFLLRAKHGTGWTPPPATGVVFEDVSLATMWADWIEQLKYEQITSGCSVAPALYCPTASVTREEMAVFLLRVKHGSAYVPPPAEGLFVDVDVARPLAAWVEQLFREGITSGCAPQHYCPDAATNRGEMAVFLSRALSLP